MADDAAATADTQKNPSGTSTPVKVETKSSKDFKDLSGIDSALLAKIDVLLAKGVFDGVSGDKFGITQNMTRAQFAKVACLIYGVKVDTSVKVSSFTDVKADDPANGWAIPFIEAAKKAGLIDGVTNTAFAPGDNVTVGQLDTVLVKGLGKKVNTSGIPWYADALKQAGDLGIHPVGKDGDSHATRADLVTSSYAGLQQYQKAGKPSQVSITAAKAAGAKLVQVTLDRDVDTSKATLSLKKNLTAVNVTVNWSDDKKSATLALTDATLTAGDYTVILGGLDSSSIKTSSATFTAENETLQKIEFITTSETVTQSKYAQIRFKATNQYGENATFNAASYSYQIGNNDVQNAKIERLADGTLRLQMDTWTNSAANPSAVSKNLQSGISVISVNIWFNDTHLSVQKNFTLGTVPFITRMDLSAVKYSSTQSSAINAKGDSATFALNAYDQYGNLLGFKALQDLLGLSNMDDLASSVSGGKVQAIFTPFEQNLDYHVKDLNYDDTPQVQVSLLNNIEKSGDYSVQIYLQGASAATKLTVSSAKIADKVQIGDLNDVIASGDTDVYIPIMAYDANGKLLSTDDLTSDANISRIKVSVSGANAEQADGTTGTNAVVKNSGNHKGFIHLTNITANAKSTVSLTAYIATVNANSTVTKTYTVSNARIPDHFATVTAPAIRAIAGAFTPIKLQVIDQYGKLLTTFNPTDDNGNSGTSVTYSVYVALKPKNGATLGTFTNNGIGNVVNNGFVLQDNYGGFDVIDSKTTGASASYKSNYYPDTISQGITDIATPISGLINAVTHLPQLHKYNDGFRINTSANAQGAVDFYAAIVKTKNGVDTTLSDITKSIDIVSKSDDLTYNLTPLKDTFNYLDSGIINNDILIGYSDQAMSLPITVTALPIAPATIAPVEPNNQITTYHDPATSFFKQELVLTAKDSAGNTVAVPFNAQSVTTSNPGVAQVGLFKTPMGTLRAYVMGNKVGSATISETYLDNKGQTLQIATKLNVKSDPISVTQLTVLDKATINSSALAWGGTGYTNIIGSTGVTGNVYNEQFRNAFSVSGINATDNYGKGYVMNPIGTAQGTFNTRRVNFQLGMLFSFSNVKTNSANAVAGKDYSVTIDNLGYIKIQNMTPGVYVTSFDLTATSPSGLSKTTAITIDNTK